ERRTLEGTLRAIAAELKVLKADFFDPLDKELKDRARCNASGALQITRVEQNRVKVFQSNAHLLARINNDELREQIVRVYGLIGGLFDYANTMAQDYDHLLSLGVSHPNENQILRAKLKELESHVRDGMQVIQGDISRALEK